MRPFGVVVASPRFNDDLWLGEAVDDLAVEQLITQLAIEAFAVSALPEAARLNVTVPGSNGSDPGTIILSTIILRMASTISVSAATEAHPTVGARLTSL